MTSMVFKKTLAAALLAAVSIASFAPAASAGSGLSVNLGERGILVQVNNNNEVPPRPNNQVPPQDNHQNNNQNDRDDGPRQNERAEPNNQRNEPNNQRNEPNNQRNGVPKPPVPEADFRMDND